MGVSEQDIFGRVPRAEPATPESYGLPPAGFRLPAATRLGPVRLQVADLGRSLAFYEETLGLRRLEREGSRALLGSPARVGADTPDALVELRERAGAPGSFTSPSCCPTAPRSVASPATSGRWGPAPAPPITW